MGDDSQTPAAAASVKATPLMPPPPPQFREGVMIEDWIANFLKLKPLVFTREDAGSDPQQVPR